MEYIYKNKILILLLWIAAGSLIFTSCDEWTEDESVTINQPANPDYDAYLSYLREYKNSDHKWVYAWFDNSEKAPFSRGQHMYDVPDSVDVVCLMYPEELAPFETEEMAMLQHNKGTKVVYSISYDVIKKDYDQMVKEEAEVNPAYVAPLFSAYLVENVKTLLMLSESYNYDGIIVGYNGQSTAYMSEEEKEAYLANQSVFINQVTSWYGNNSGKMLVFEGNPQFLSDNSILSSCKHIILNTLSAAYANELSVYAQEAIVQGMPIDRFIVSVNATSIDPADKNTGYYGEDRATIEAAYWVTEKAEGYTKAGLGIYNIQNDYYNIAEVYQYAKESINIMNPAPVN